MTAIYIAMAAIVVLIFVGLGVSNWLTTRSRSQALAIDVATPTPGAIPTTKPKQLVPGEAIGQPIFGEPTPNPQKGILPDTAQGGKGQPVDGIPCQATEAVALHVHTDLSIIANGAQIQIPPFIGFALDPSSQNGFCLYWLHTHDGSGVIHIEAGDVSAPHGGPFTLGNFFDVWGQPLSRTQVGPFKGGVTVYLNGQPYNGDLATIPLVAHQRITLEVGKPVIPPPTYLIPADE